MRPNQRLAYNLRQTLTDGFDRLVLSRPGGGGEEVHPAPDSPTATEALIAHALAQAKAGLVKIAVVHKDGGRTLLDARHGSARLVPAAQTVDKAMAGKARALRPDDNGPLLRAIGIQNADGSISATNAKKYKQVSHLVELLRPAWQAAAASRPVDEAAPLRILDLACGNAVLSFVLADALRGAGLPCRLRGVDRRADLVTRCVTRAAELDLPQLSFSEATIAEAAGLTDALGGPPDLVLALHACDGATDEALQVGVSLGAAALFVVPCCQAELAQSLRRTRGGPTPAYRHGLLLREHAATLTDALRVDWLEAQGYEVDVVEFIDLGHTAKNRLLRATRTGPARPEALAAWKARGEALGALPSGLSAASAG